MGNYIFKKKESTIKTEKIIAIERFIEECLSDEDLNSCIPDYYEMKMYKNLFTKIVTLLEKVAETTEMKILNHRIRIIVEPIDEDED